METRLCFSICYHQDIIGVWAQSFNRPTYQMQPNELKRTIPANEQRKFYETKAAVNGKELKD